MTKGVHGVDDRVAAHRLLLVVQPLVEPSAALLGADAEVEVVAAGAKTGICPGTPMLVFRKDK